MTLDRLIEAAYDDHAQNLYRYAAAILGDQELARDAVHSVFTRLARRVFFPRNPAAYLRRAVRNECYSLLRKRQAGAVEAMVDAAVPTRFAEDDRLALQEALTRLAPAQREVVFLHVYEGRTLNEIAIASNESINTIAGRYRYAIQYLRRMFRGM